MWKWVSEPFVLRISKYTICSHFFQLSDVAEDASQLFNSAFVIIVRKNSSLSHCYGFLTNA